MFDFIETGRDAQAIHDVNFVSCVGTPIREWSVYGVLRIMEDG